MCWEIRRYEGDLLLVFRRSGTIVQHYSIRNEDVCDANFLLTLRL